MSKLSLTHIRLKSKTTPKNIALKISIITLLAATTVAAPLGRVYADKYQDQINQLQQQNSQKAVEQQALDVKEADLASAVAEGNAKIAAIETQIGENQAKNRAIEQRIVEIEQDLTKQRAILKINIKQMYLDDQITTIEKVASSKNLSEYADKEQYRVSVQNKIKTAMDRINALKAEQEKQKATIQKLIADQEAMRGQIAAQKAENDRLLSLNLAQQAAYSKDVQANNSKISSLRQQQAAENARNFVGGVHYGGSSYPWANVAYPSSQVDPWGMYKRECVSYTAWKVASTGRYMPYWGGQGNANQWDDNARNSGIPVDGSPRVGDVAVSNAGYYGHVMYVEAVYGDGTIYISQYNAGWDGRYSEGRRTTSGLVFIHF